MASILAGAVLLIAVASSLLRATIEIVFLRAVSLKFQFPRWERRDQGWWRRSLRAYTRATAKFAISLVLGFLVPTVVIYLARDVLNMDASRWLATPFDVITSVPAQVVYAALLAAAAFGAEGDRTFPALSALVGCVANDVKWVLANAMGIAEDSSTVQKSSALVPKWALLAGIQVEPIVPKQETGAKVVALMESAHTVMNRDIPEKIASDGVGAVFAFLIGAGASGTRAALMVLPAAVIVAAMRVMMLRSARRFVKNYEQYLEGLRDIVTSVDEPLRTRERPGGSVPDRVGLPLSAGELRTILDADSLSDELAAMIAHDLTIEISKRIAVASAPKLARDDADVVFRLIAGEQWDALLQFIRLTVPDVERQASRLLGEMLREGQSETGALRRAFAESRPVAR